MEDKDVEIKLNSTKKMLDEVLKELQHMVQIREALDGERADTKPYERCIARVSSASLLLTTAMQDFMSVKQSIATLYDVLGCKKIKRDMA